MAEKPARTATRRLPRDQRVAIIMQAARAVLREYGYEQFLTAEVAARCNVSEGTIYKYFPTKRDLLIRVAEDWFEEFLTTHPEPSLQRPIRDRLFHVIWESLESVRREPALSRFVLMELRSDPAYRTMRIYQQNRRITQKVMDVVEQGVARGELRADLPMTLLRNMIFGAIEHETWAFLRGDGDFSVEDSAEGMTDILMRGIAVQPAASATPESAAIERLERVTQDLRAELAALRTAPALSEGA